MVPVSAPFTSETPPNVTALMSDTKLPLALTMPKNMAPFLDKYGSISGVEDHVVDCQSVVPARKERTMRPVGWAAHKVGGTSAETRVNRQSGHGENLLCCPARYLWGRRRGVGNEPEPRQDSAHRNE